MVALKGLHKPVFTLAIPNVLPGAIVVACAVNLVRGAITRWLSLSICTQDEYMVSMASILFQCVAGLADHDRAGTHDLNLTDIIAFGHCPLSYVQ